MIFILGWIVFAVGLAFFLWFKKRDWWKSSLQPLHLPPNEKNFATKGKDGYFDQTRAYIVSGVVIAVFTAAAIFIPWPYTPFLVGGMFFAWGLYVMDGIRKDIAVLNRHEKEQRATLTVLRADPEGHVPLPTLKVYGKGHKFILGTFYDFAEDTDIPFGGVHEIPDFRVKQEAARDKIKPRLVKLAQMNESTWFIVGRALKV